MTAIREQILAICDTRLAAIVAPGGEYERNASGDPSRFNALFLNDDGQDIAETEAGATRYALRLTVEGYVQGGTGAAASAALNELYAGVVATMMTEPPMGGLAETIEEGRLNVAVANLAGERRLGFTLDFTITFPTRRGDASSQ
jgi:hypothetical protein